VEVAQLSTSELERARAMPVLMKALLFSRIADEDVLASDVDVAAATWASIKLVGHGHREHDRMPVEVGPRQTPAAAGQEGTVGHATKIRCPQINLRGRCPAGSGRAPGTYSGSDLRRDLGQSHSGGRCRSQPGRMRSGVDPITARFALYPGLVSLDLLVP
jgi:hypothetical protein